MNVTIVYAIVLLAALGLVLALILYVVAQKFKVEEDPRIDLVADALPGANCGACGKAGCRAMAEAIVKDASLTGCPVCNEENIGKIAEILGRVAEKSEPRVAVVRCQGGTCNTTPKVKYEGYQSCAYATSVFPGEGGCPFGCLGLGDCEKACTFDAIHVNPQTGLPEVDPDKCTACGACAKACPRGVIEVRKKREKTGRVVVACVNKQKGASAVKVCKVSCIGCGKCVQTCPKQAITLENNLAYINDDLCVSCQLCVRVCPRNAITVLPKEKLRPAPAPKPAAPAAAAPQAETPAQA